VLDIESLCLAQHVAADRGWHIFWQGLVQPISGSRRFVLQQKSWELQNFIRPRFSWWWLPVGEHLDRPAGDAYKHPYWS
jgi:hypothetical protein